MKNVARYKKKINNVIFKTFETQKPKQSYSWPEQSKSCWQWIHLISLSEKWLLFFSFGGRHIKKKQPLCEKTWGLFYTETKMLAWGSRSRQLYGDSEGSANTAQCLWLKVCQSVCSLHNVSFSPAAALTVPPRQQPQARFTDGPLEWQPSWSSRAAAELIELFGFFFSKTS